MFRALWLASLASNIGTWMQSVAAAWLMTSLTSSTELVALLQTAASLPVFLVGIPAGALADVVDRRRLLLVTQGWMLAVAGALGWLSMAGRMTEWGLLGLTFLLGLGAALNAPAWQAIVPTLVDRAQLPSAVALNGAGFNLARAIGPALGGLVVAAAGPGAVFLLNAASFLGVLAVVYGWRMPAEARAAPPETVLGAVQAGIRYARGAPELQAVLVRAGAFVAAASALWALLPVVARGRLGLGAGGYGLLLGSVGVGAVLGAALLPRLRSRLSADQLAAAATLAFAGATAALATLRQVWLISAVLLLAGVAWLAQTSSLNIAAQTSVPAWVRARALGVYLLVFQGGMALGSAAWGLLAGRVGDSAALLAAAVTLLAALLVARRWRLPADEGRDLSPSAHWPEPQAITAPEAGDGPVLVTITYVVDEAHAREFARAMAAMQRLRRRDGAVRWGLFRDVAAPARYVETFIVPSWAEHMRQHERVTVADRAVEERARAFQQPGTTPVVSHLIAVR